MVFAGGAGRAQTAAQAAPVVATQPAFPAAGAPVMGRRLLDREGAEIGRLVDVLLDHAGHPTAAVVDVGGFLGVGVRRVAVGWNLLEFSATADGLRIAVALEADVVAAAAEYRSDDAEPAILRQR